MKITFVPEDKDLFKSKIIATRRARRVIEYMDGTIIEKPWRLQTFDKTSNLLGNIESQSWYTKDRANIRQVVLIAEDCLKSDAIDIFEERVKKGKKQKPITPPNQGRDENRRLVYYNENVGYNERVEGLCEKLEIEYLEFVRNFAFDIFRDIIDFDYIPEVVLCKECPSEIWTHSDSFVTKKVNELIKKGDLVNEQEIAQILRHCSRIGGCFIHNPRPLIKIYFYQFESVDWDEYFAKISQTLAHEYMHYLHFAYTPKSFAYRNEKNKDIKEALADFFCMIYSLKRATDRHCAMPKYRINVAKDTYDSWVKWDGSGWPYAYALCFMQNRINTFSPYFAEYDSKRCIAKLVEVFLATKHIDNAYSILINL